MWDQWLPESARYDVLTGNQEKALATLKRIATENGVPMPLGKLIAARQVQPVCIEGRSSLCNSKSTLFIYEALIMLAFEYLGLLLFPIFFELGGTWEVSRLIFRAISLYHSSAVVYLVNSVNYYSTQSCSHSFLTETFILIHQHLDILPLHMHLHQSFGSYHILHVE